MFDKFFKYPLDEFGRGMIRFALNLRPEVVLLAAVAALAVAFFYYRGAPRTVSTPRRFLLAGLRGLALGLIALILLGPVLEQALPHTADSFVAVIVDDSRSMSIGDAGPGGARAAKDQRRTRLEAAKRLLSAKAGGIGTSEQGLLEELAGTCPVMLYRFSAQAERIETVKDLSATGERTDLYAALKITDAELHNLPLAGVVLVTDGAANAGGSAEDLHDLARLLRARNAPVFAVGLGDIAPPNDYEVVRIQAPREIARNATVEIFATVRASGYTGPFEVVLRQGQTALERQRVLLAEGAEAQRVRFVFKPEQTGDCRLTVEIPPGAGEVIADNNLRECLVTVVDKRLPVLYLEGSPREEYRFLRRALYRDKDFRIVSILRLDGPKKFILQGNEPEDGLEKGYPTTVEHLFRFEAVIFGDIEAGFLTSEQLAATEAFVRQRGGGFAMLGGVNSFNLGKYQGTPVESMLPVVLPSATAPYEQREFSLALTEAGEKHLIMWQNTNPIFNRNIWGKAPSLIGLNPVAAAKPGAQVLAVEAKTDRPVLTVQQYGAGRTAAFTSGGSWHWRMALPVEEELHEKFWKQLVRWLAVGSKPKLAIELNKDLYARKEPVLIRTTVLDKLMNPANDATVVARVTDPFGAKHELAQEWTLSGEGVYQAQYEPTDGGDYRLEVTATLKDGSTLTASTSFSVGETLDEFADVAQNVALLKSLAAASGGQYFTGEQAGKVPAAVAAQARELKKDQTSYRRLDLWDAPVIFVLAVLCLTLEWLLRRRAGLM